MTFALAASTLVHRIGFGAMRLTGQPGNFGRYPAWDEGKQLLRRAVELGVNHIDTAYAYGPGHSEELIAEALYPYPSDLVIATKGGVEKPEPGKVFADGRPETLRQHLESSLRRLRTETIDVYYLHRPDPNVPFVESVGALANFRDEGKVRHIALSNVSLAELQIALSVTQIVAVQNRYNVLETDAQDVLEFTSTQGIAFVPWGPLAAQPFSPDAPLAQGGNVNGKSAAQVALRQLLERAPNVLLIPGTTRVTHLEENLRA
jgi:aryl-alcohol dehydrogenase-like predicted oxidoreductase